MPPAREEVPLTQTSTEPAGSSGATTQNQLLCCKSIDKLIADADAPGHRLEKKLGPVVADRAGHRRHHRLGHFRSHGHRRGRRTFRGAVYPARAGARPVHKFPANGKHCRSADAWPPGGRAVDCDFISSGGGGLQLRRTVLRRTGFHDSDCRQRVHLLVRHARRNLSPGSSAGI